MTKEIKKVMNLDNPIPEDSLNGYLFSNENKGHKFVVSCMRGGELLTLTGTVTARFMRANNTTILIAGNDYTGIVDGKAVVTLPQDCYNVPGRFQMAIFLTADGTTSCIYACVGSVQRTQNGDLIDSGDAVPSLEELLAQIDACEQATADATAAAAAVPGLIANTFSASAVYTAGSYVYYNGSLYRFTADHAAGVWIGSDATAVKLANDVGDLRSAIGTITYTWQDGVKAASDSGLVLTDASYSVTTIPVAMNSSISGFTRANGVYAGICFYDVYGAFISGSYNSSGNDWTYDVDVPDNAAVVKISCLTADKSTRFKFSQNDISISAAKTTQQTLQDYTITQRRYTTNDTLNGYISDCKVVIKSSSVKKVLLAVYAYSNGSMRFYKYDANGDRTATIISKSNYFDASSKLLVYSDNDIDIKMIIDWANVSATLEGYYTAYAQQESALFDARNYPNDRHIAVVPAENVITLAQLMELRNAIGGAMFSASYTVDIFNGLNGYYLVRLYDNNSVAAQGTFVAGQAGLVSLGAYGNIYFDPTYLTGTFYGKTALANVDRNSNDFLALYTEQKHVFYCGSGRSLATLKAGIEAATKYMDSVLYVDAGEYDLVDEFGDSYFESLTSGHSMSGLQLKNRVHVVFSPDSVVKCNYEGDNEYALSLFSPFNAGAYGFTLENLTLECSRCRYGLHDERNGATEQYKSHLINCHITFDNTAENTAWAYGSCIGGGFGSNAEVIIENCVLKKIASDSAVGYYHQSNDTSNANHAFKFIFRNNYTINGSFRVEATRSDATLDSTVIACGNDLAVADFGTYGITGTHVNAYVWNNTVRT